MIKTWNDNNTLLREKNNLSLDKDSGITAKDLYEWAKKKGIENVPLVTWGEDKSFDDYDQINSAELEFDVYIGDVIYLHF